MVVFFRKGNVKVKKRLNTVKSDNQKEHSRSEMCIQAIILRINIDYINYILEKEEISFYSD